MNELMDLIASYGFPMAIATYLLVRIDKRLASLEGSIRDLIVVIKGKDF